MGGDTTEVGAGLPPWEGEVDLVVGGDLVHQRILQDREAVAKADGDVAPNLPVGQLEDAVGCQGWMPFGQGVKAPLQIREGLVGEQAVDGPKRSLLDGEQLIGAGDGLGSDIVHEGHEQVQLRFLPEILPLIGVGGVLDDDLRDGLYQILVCLDPAQAVPSVTVLHVQKVEHLDLVAPLPEISGHTLVNLSLRVHADQALLFVAFVSTLKDKGLDHALGLSGACGTVNHEVFR